jgi:hypothetical protein
MTTEERKAFLYGLIRNLIDYCSPVFVKIPASLQIKLNRIQRRAQKIICDNETCSTFDDLLSRRERLSLKLFAVIIEIFYADCIPTTGAYLGNLASRAN